MGREEEMPDSCKAVFRPAEALAKKEEQMGKIHTAGTVPEP